MTTTRVSGADLDLKINPAELTARQRQAVIKGLRHAAEETRTYAVELTPKDRGHLRASAEVSVDPAALEAAISYNVPYAVYVHERLELRHKVGEAKFLEKAVAVKAEDMQAILAKYLREVFE
ncbi:HK97 gp10 family phage protein [Nonomuraea sp. LPB2021202275-12-8]|uniref:HK97 gp10 family phage protein n=1 Tax=Nonomuraea sp. LPB2021202275-12-8 TaxID=3120159 RepID=UPI00300CD92E